jgi:hypothetical protein
VFSWYRCHRAQTRRCPATLSLNIEHLGLIVCAPDNPYVLVEERRANP